MARAPAGCCPARCHWPASPARDGCPCAPSRWPHTPPASPRRAGARGVRLGHRRHRSGHWCCRSGTAPAGSHWRHGSPPVKARRDGIACGLRVVGHQLRQFFQRQRTRRPRAPTRPSDVGARLRRPRGGRHWRCASRLQRTHRDAPHVPELGHDAIPAACTASVTTRQAAICSGLWMPGCRNSPGHRAGSASPADQETCRRTLRVVRGGQRRNHLARRTVARQRGHHDAVGERDVAEAGGVNRVGI